jgi:hypothetical protein
MSERIIKKVKVQAMKIDDIQIEAVAKNHLRANIARVGDAFILVHN